MPYQRAKILINRRFQLKFAFFVCSWIFALSMVYPLIIFSLFEMFLKFVPQDSAQSLAHIKDIQGQVLFLLALLQLAVLLITFLISIFLSHRIAGPIYRIKKAMEEISKGNFDQRVTLRKNDHFMELQDSFNEMSQHLAVRKWR